MIAVFLYEGEGSLPDHPTGTALHNAHEAKSLKLRHINSSIKPVL
jgi:hypothetical protein